MPDSDNAFPLLKTLCEAAWQRGLLAGFNGNISLRRKDYCYVTESGSAKGYLQPENIAVVHIASGSVCSGTPSSELGMHLALYRQQADMHAIVHTHPRHMLALELCVPWETFLCLPLFEAERLRAQLGFARALPPGTPELALDVAAAHRGKNAVWLSRHGLCVAASTPTQALALSEELEHLAAVQLLTLRR